MEDETQLFKQAFGRSFDNPKYSDATIEARGQKFRVHKLVLASHSPVMDAAFSGGWKEAKDGVMNIDDDPAVVKSMLSYMYSFTYPVKVVSATGSVWGKQMTDKKPDETTQSYNAAVLLFHAKVYCMAEMYTIPHLKYDEPETEDFALVVREVYNSTPDTDQGLRALVVEKVRQKVGPLMENVRFKALLREVVGFAAELAEALARVPSKPAGCWYGWYCNCRRRKIDESSPQFCYIPEGTSANVTFRCNYNTSHGVEQAGEEEIKAFLKTK